MLFSKYEQLESLNRIIIEEFIDKIYILYEKFPDKKSGNF